MDDATIAYAWNAMDNLQRAGVKIRLFYLRDRVLPDGTTMQVKGAFRRAIEDELNGVPLP